MNELVRSTTTHFYKEGSNYTIHLESSDPDIYKVMESAGANDHEIIAATYRIDEAYGTVQLDIELADVDHTEGIHNEKGEEKAMKNAKKPCYFWKQYKYSVDARDITLKGWVDWCNELYMIQHGRPRPRNNRIFINPDMETAIVKGRFWNKDKIEKWLDDHGYKWTMDIETRYQFPFESEDEVLLIDSDAELMARNTRKGA